MAYLSKVKISGNTYSLKDTEARTAIENLSNAVSSAMIIKGVISSAAEITSLTDYKQGWTYKIANSFYFEGELVENGDMIICISDYDNLYKASDWNIVQNNVDIMQGANNSSAGVRGLVPAPAAQDNNKYLRGDGTWETPTLAWGTFSDLV